MADPKNGTATSKPDYSVYAHKIPGFGVVVMTDNHNDPLTPPRKQDGSLHTFAQLNEYSKERGLRQAAFVKLEGENKFTRLDIKEIISSRAGDDIRFAYKGANVSLLLQDPVSSTGILKIGENEPITFSNQQVDQKTKDAYQAAVKKELEQTGLLPSATNRKVSQISEPSNDFALA